MNHQPERAAAPEEMAGIGGIVRNPRAGTVEIISRFLRGFLLILPLLAANPAPAADFVYLIDTSISMKTRRESVVELASLDIARALLGPNPIYREGDQIHIWSFDLNVQDHLKLDFQPGTETDLRARIGSSLNRLRMEGRGTSLTKPLTNALATFGPASTNELSIVLYTDGRAKVPAKEADYIVRLYKFYFEPTYRLANVVLIRFGDKPLAKDAAGLIASIGGRTVAAGEPLVFSGQRPVEAAAKEPEAKVPSVISVTPKTIQFSQPLAAEILQISPVEFKVEPPQPGLLVRLSLEATNLPSGMTMALTVDRLATEGKQVVPLTIHGAQPGQYTARLLLAASVPIEPSAIPVSIQILESIPDHIGLQFFSDSAGPIDLPANGQWHKIPSAGLSLFYPDRLKETRVYFEGEVPAGVELQAIAGADPGQELELGKAMTLGALGRLVGFQFRSASTNVIGKSLAAKISLRLQPGQNARTDGADALRIPFRFVVAGEVRIETTEIALGPVLRGTRGVKRTLNLQVKGEAAGKKLRVIKRGQGLAGITIAPSEFVLTPGAMSVDVEFGGFDDRSPGPIDGTFSLVAEEPAAVDLRGGIVSVRGTLPSPGSLVAEIENPMVAGQPFYIRARLDSHTNRTFLALVRRPEANKEFEVTLSDSGSAEDGDAKPNDGTYSGAFKRTELPGNYQVAISCAGAKAEAQTVSLNVPMYFKAQAEPLKGSLAQRGDGRYLQRQFKVVSDYPGPIALHMEPTESQSGLNTYVSTKNLKPGENTIDLVIGLTPETRAGEHKYKIHLITDPIGEKRARIPASLEITVVSFFQYFVNLLSLTLAIGGVVLLGVLVPWRKFGWRSGKRKADHHSLPDREEGDETLA